MTSASITSLDSFRHRAQQSEQWRTVLMLAVLGVQAVIIVARRLMGGAVMREDGIFYGSLFVTAALIAYELFMLDRIRSANRDGRLLPDRVWVAGAAIELAGPILLLSLNQAFTPGSHVTAVTAPALLDFPIVIVLSILRLRPRFPLVIGLVAAVAHAALTFIAVRVDRPSADMLPMLMTYPVLIALCGACAAVVAREAKRHVRESIDETVVSERARQQLQSVQHDLGIARDIQNGLIPRTPPRLDGFEIAGFNRPADLTGGDYYDWQTLADGRAVVALADVTGHGIGPALVMAICRAYARAVFPVLPDLREVLGRLNQLICDDVQGQRFITLAVALIDPKSSTVQLISAGHGPSLLYRAATKSIERFDGDGLPLGIVSDAGYDVARSLSLQPGDCLLLMTDGYFEWRRGFDNQQFGIDRVTAVLRDHASADAATLLQRLDDEVRRFADGSVQADDMTAVIIKRR